LNEEVDKHAKEHLKWSKENGNKKIVCTNRVIQSDDIWCNSEDLAKFPVLIYGGVKRSASIEDSLHKAYNKKLYSQYNQKKLGDKYNQFLHKKRIEVLQQL